MPVAREWSDLDIEFAAHPNTGDLSLKKDTDAIGRSFMHLLLTNHYERPFHPEIGCNIYAQLFEPMTYATALRIQTSIEETINNFEPRVQLSEVIVQAEEQDNGYLVKLKFFVVNQEVERVTSFFLERSR